MVCFIIFGIDSKVKAKPSGTFQCPVCNVQRTYGELRQSRRFTLFFIPVLPLGSTSLNRVQCMTCDSEFDSGVT